MGEKSGRLASVSDTEIVSGFRAALVALVPILQKLDVLEDLFEPYDDFDDLADSLWDILVLRSLMWKYGTDSPPNLPCYGHAEAGMADGYIRASSPTAAGRFVEFTTPPDSREPFSSVTVYDESGQRIAMPSNGVEFDWVRKPPG